MRKILAVLVLMGICSSVHATELSVIESSITIHTVAISSEVVTAITGSSNLMKNRTILQLQNLDAADVIYCSFNSVAITTTTTTDNTFQVPITGLPITVAIRGFGVWCINNAGDGPTKLSVLQGY